MKIEATDYKREDGKTLHQISDGNWLIRKVEGPTWFYNSQKKTWHIITALSRDDLAALALPFDEAWTIFNTVP